MNLSLVAVGYKPPDSEHRANEINGRTQVILSYKPPFYRGFIPRCNGLSGKPVTPC